MNRWFLLLSTVLFLLCSCGKGSDTSIVEDEVDSTRPNIVIIFADDQGYQDLGCYGSPTIKTPNIDQMAKEGIRFTNFYVSQPVCSASRASLMTGCYPSRLGISGAFGPFIGKGLNPDEMTIAEVLKPLGYHTACYGKWHLGSEREFLPTSQGFDEYYGLTVSNDMWPFHPEGFKFPDLSLFENETIIDTMGDQSMLTTEYTERAVNFIKKNKEHPFFLYVPHSMPHVPLFVSDKHKGKSAGGIYGDVIEEMDWSTGEILKTLKEEGLDDNTWVIYTSDNGPWLSYGTHSGSALPLREGKGTCLEGGVRVPCVMRWPGNIEAGKTISQPAMTIDMLPTIVEEVKAEMPPNKIDGRSMSDLIFERGEYSSHHDAYYFYYKQNELHAVLSGDGKWKLYVPHSYRSLNGRTGRDDGYPIKYDHDNKMGTELYDLENDISETKNVIDDHPEVAAELMKHVEEARAELGDKLTDRVGSGVRELGQIVTSN